MIVFPNAKLNLGLHIVGKRPDGYHDLQTVFYPVPPEDALEVVPRQPDDTTTDEPCRLHLSGIEVNGATSDNLVVKAYRLLAADYPLPPVEVYLHKQIPTGAGLGGGSADATFMLKLLNSRFDLQLDTQTLEAYAARLGADCPFFVNNRPVYAEGTGDRFTPIDLSLHGKQLVVVHPGIFISTREAFSHLRPHKPEIDIREVITRPLTEWKELLTNDFEAALFPYHPTLARLKDELYAKGALYAAMSGSGSALFGLFPGLTRIDTDFETPHRAVWVERM
ncbi:MAG: 4-(cytidine 5'-diphospho)-2-C-methyl-D-erythritol kinase [Mediterranea sp.]|jgi:4-diphosphocytidyl-2-C-methyl-D-erythritol kinase|nr:4-(cytidine 5'-diphospho)-2-C-methyl-D-erythritol kinase [Mediterranea sp.]